MANVFFCDDGMNSIVALNLFIDVTLLVTSKKKIVQKESGYDSCLVLACEHSTFDDYQPCMTDI